MQGKTALTGLIIVATLACNSSSRDDDFHVSAASLLTNDYSHSRLASWNVRANAAGANCDVLLVETSVILEDSMVNALHYGAGAYGVYAGGVQRFSTDHSFRGVAYKDSTGHLWTFGGVTATEAETLTQCGSRKSRAASLLTRRRSSIASLLSPSHLYEAEATAALASRRNSPAYRR
jgi:hypothetical protein